MDAVQETFARVLRSGDSFRSQSSPLTWMYRISTNWCLNQLRNRRGRERKHTDHREDIVGRPEIEADGSEAFDRDRILALLDGCDDQTRAVVVHTYFDDCTREEVAALVGISVPTVRKRINTFLDQARRELGVALVAVGALLAVWSGA